MKTKNRKSFLDDQLILMFQDIFSDDETGYEEAIRDAERAFSFIKRVELKRNS